MGWSGTTMDLGMYLMMDRLVMLRVGIDDGIGK